MKITYNHKLYTELASVEIDLYGKHELRHYFKIMKCTRQTAYGIEELYYLQLHDNKHKLLKDIGNDSDLTEVENMLESILRDGIKYLQNKIS